MTAFFIYSPDGGPQPPAALEFAPNLAVPQIQLMRRTADNTGTAAYAADLEGTIGTTWRGFHRIQCEEEWPPATKDARLWVWRRYAADGVPDVATEPADEVWTLTEDGAFDRQRWAEDVRPRIQGAQ